VEVIPAMADLAIFQHELNITRVNEVDQQYNITVPVHNLGEASAQGIIRFYESDMGFLDILIDEERVMLEPGETTNISVLWTPKEDELVYVELQVTQQEDWDWTNDWAYVTIIEDRELDLSVNDDEIFLLEFPFEEMEPPFRGDEQEYLDEFALAAVVHNQGESPGYADVEFYLDDIDNDESYFLGSDRVNVMPGEAQLAITFPWFNPFYVYDLGDEFELVVELFDIGPYEDDEPSNDMAGSEYPPDIHQLPDLSVSSENITINPVEPDEGDNVTFDIGVANHGEMEGLVLVELYHVEFYLDEPFVGEWITGIELNIEPDDSGVAHLGGWLPEAGNYTLCVIVEDIGLFPDANPDDNLAYFEVRVGTPDDQKPDEPKPDDPSDEDLLALPNFNWPSGMVGLALVASLAGIGALGGTTVLWYSERSRWWLFTGFFIPLLSRIKREELEEPDKFKAGQLYQTIKLNPGINLTALIHLAEMGNGTLIHHLSRLEHDGLIKSVKQGQLRLYYSTKRSVDDENTNKLRYLRETQKRVLKVLARHPESSQREIADMLELKQQLVSYHLRELLRLGFIRRKGLRRFYSYYLEDGVAAKMTLEGAA